MQQSSNMPGDSWDHFAEQARSQQPGIAIILGSGHGKLCEHLQQRRTISYANIPSMVKPTVAGHAGALHLGRWAGQTVLLFAGRVHLYEGHAREQVVRPAIIAHELGTRVFLATNSAGGIRDDLAPGCLVALHDHLDATHPCWWRNPGSGNVRDGSGLGTSNGSISNHSTLDRSTLDRSKSARPAPYSRRLLDQLINSAASSGIPLSTGLYAQMTGPCYETHAEVRALKFLGVDAVGMSTACEIERAHQLGMECVGLSCISNKAAGLAPGPLHHDEVLVEARQAQQRLAQLLETFIEALS